MKQGWLFDRACEHAAGQAGIPSESGFGPMVHEALRHCSCITVLQCGSAAVPRRCDVAALQYCRSGAVLSAVGAALPVPRRRG